MAMKTFLCFAAGWLVFAAMLGIGEKKEQDRGHAYLELKLENKTGEEIDQTAVVLGKNRCTSGILGKGAAKTYLGWQKPVGTNAVVEWRDGKKTKQEVTVSIAEIYRPGADGRLVFSIMPTNAPTNVVVKFETIEVRASAR
jgi:hypothetical protein